MDVGLDVAASVGLEVRLDWM